MMDDLLYSFSKEECIAFLEDIEQRSAAASSVTYNFSSKNERKKEYYEVMDARARLCTIEDKERLQNLAQRLDAFVI